VITIDAQLHDGQKLIFRNRRRFNTVACGRRFGKTVMAEALLIESAIMGKPAAYFAPTYKMLSDVWKALKTTLHPIITGVSEQEKRLTIETGGIIDCWSLDAFDSVRGRKYARVVCDEVAMVRNFMDAWNEAIRPTLTDYKGDGYFFSTPKGRNDFHAMYERARLEETYASFRMPTSVNPYIAQDEINAAQRELPTVVFNQEYLAEFVDVQGALVKREMITYVNSDQVPRDLKIGMGVDLAISKSDTADYTAIAVVGYDKDSARRYVLDMWRGKVGFHEVVQGVQSLAAKWNPSRINIEAVQYQVAVVQELLRKTSLPVKAVKPDRDKVTRFHALLARYEQLLVTHVRGLEPSFEQELLSFPEGNHDDMVDALVYAEMAAVKSQGAGVVFL
jgi:predicted phage terminase large subunit-like protein